MGRALELVAPGPFDRLHRVVAGLLPAGLRVTHPGAKLQKLASALQADDAADVYRRLVSQWLRPETLVERGCEVATAVADDTLATDVPAFVPRMMLLDLVTYLPDDILVKVDRASMAVSLEARAPLLDHRLVEWAWRLPLSMKIRQGQGKWLLRQLLYRHVPAALVERPKSGFAVPVGEWLRGPLRDWAETLLDERRLRREGYLRPGPIRATWRAHLTGRRNEEARLWAVLMFQAWRERWSA